MKNGLFFFIFVFSIIGIVHSEDNNTELLVGSWSGGGPSWCHFNNDGSFIYTVGDFSRASGRYYATNNRIILIADGVGVGYYHYTIFYDFFRDKYKLVIIKEFSDTDFFDYPGWFEKDD